MQRATVRRIALDAWPLLVAVVLLLPLLTRPGIPLARDLVFVPRQPWTDAVLGLGDAAPRAVPLDALVSLATVVVDGGVLARRRAARCCWPPPAGEPTGWCATSAPRPGSRRVASRCGTPSSWSVSPSGSGRCSRRTPPCRGWRWRPRASAAPAASPTSPRWRSGSRSPRSPPPAACSARRPPWCSGSAGRRRALRLVPVGARAPAAVAAAGADRRRRPHLGPRRGRRVRGAGRGPRRRGHRGPRARRDLGLGQRARQPGDLVGHRDRRGRRRRARGRRSPPVAAVRPATTPRAGRGLAAGGLLLALASSTGRRRRRPRAGPSRPCPAPVCSATARSSSRPSPSSRWPRVAATLHLARRAGPVLGRRGGSRPWPSPSSRSRSCCCRTPPAWCGPPSTRSSRRPTSTPWPRWSTARDRDLVTLPWRSYRRFEWGSDLISSDPAVRLVRRRRGGRRRPGRRRRDRGGGERPGPRRSARALEQSAAGRGARARSGVGWVLVYLDDPGRRRARPHRPHGGVRRRRPGALLPARCRVGSGRPGRRRTLAGWCSATWPRCSSWPPRSSSGSPRESAGRRHRR